MGRNRNMNPNMNKRRNRNPNPNLSEERNHNPNPNQKKGMDPKTIKNTENKLIDLLIRSMNL